MKRKKINLRWSGNNEAQQQADAAWNALREKNFGKKKSKKGKQRQKHWCTTALFEHYQAEARKRGMILHQGKGTRPPVHWMFEDVETGLRLLNYYPKSKTGFIPGGRGFHVGDVSRAMDVARSGVVPTETDT